MIDLDVIEHEMNMIHAELLLGLREPKECRKKLNKLLCEFIYTRTNKEHKMYLLGLYGRINDKIGRCKH
jgi:hypothetical protein